MRELSKAGSRFRSAASWGPPGAGGRLLPAARNFSRQPRHCGSGWSL